MAHEPRFVVRTTGRGFYLVQTQFLIKHADNVGETRFANGRSHRLAGKQGLREDDPEKLRWLDIHGARCESAINEWLGPCHWNLGKSVFDTKLPDIVVPREHGLPIEIDVKGVRLDSHHLLVPTEYHPSWAYVMVSWESHPAYWIGGWVWGFEVEQSWYGTMADERWSYCVPPKALHHWYELEAACERRRARETRMGQVPIPHSLPTL